LRQFPKPDLSSIQSLVHLQRELLQKEGMWSSTNLFYVFALVLFVPSANWLCADWSDATLILLLKYQKRKSKGSPRTKLLTLPLPAPSSSLPVQESNFMWNAFNRSGSSYVLLFYFSNSLCLILTFRAEPSRILDLYLLPESVLKLQLKGTLYHSSSIDCSVC
jgi:hypothetical protein